MLALVLFTSACEKEETNSEQSTMPNTFSLVFMLVDSAGNNLLPRDLPDDPVFNPLDFSAHSPRNDSIGYYTRYTTDSSGHLFWVRENMNDIKNSPGYQHDSTFVLYPCFGSDCDTVVVYKKTPYPRTGDSTSMGCFAERLVWNSDTISNYYCTIIHLKKFQP